MIGNYERNCRLQTKKILTPVRCLRRDFQRRGAFVASLSIDKKKTFFHCAIENWFQILEKCLCQSLHDAKDKLQLELSGCCQLPSELPLN
jgi:hypothetical protein